MGQLEFPLPYWDNVSETAKVNISVCMDCMVCLCVLWMDPHVGGHSLYVKGIKTHQCLFAAEGADSIHAGGGGGSEIHCPPGARAPLGHCKYSVNWAFTSTELQYFSHKYWLFFPLLPGSIQDEGLCENDHQLSVAGKIKKHFNTSPKVNDTTAGVSVISVSKNYSTHKQTGLTDS